MKPASPASRETPGAGAPPSSLTRNALIPSSILLCFVLAYVVGVPVPWVVAVGLSFMTLYVAAPALGRRSMARFDRDAVRLLAAGRRDALERRFALALAMRLFASPALVAQRRGMVAAERGDAHAARDAYRDALEAWGGAAPLAVRLGLAHACFALGDDAEAAEGYRAVLGTSRGLPQVRENLARALVRLDRDLDEAEGLATELAREAGSASASRALLLQALVDARRGKRAAARKLLARVPEADEPQLETIRREVAVLLTGEGGSRSRPR